MPDGERRDRRGVDPAREHDRERNVADERRSDRVVETRTKFLLDISLERLGIGRNRVPVLPDVQASVSQPKPVSETRGLPAVSRMLTWGSDEAGQPPLPLVTSTRMLSPPARVIGLCVVVPFQVTRRPPWTVTGA